MSPFEHNWDLKSPLECVTKKTASNIVNCLKGDKSNISMEMCSESGLVPPNVTGRFENIWTSVCFAQIVIHNLQNTKKHYTGAKYTRSATLVSSSIRLPCCCNQYSSDPRSDILLRILDTGPLSKETSGPWNLVQNTIIHTGCLKKSC